MHLAPSYSRHQPKFIFHHPSSNAEKIQKSLQSRYSPYPTLVASVPSVHDLGYISPNIPQLATDQIDLTVDNSSRHSHEIDLHMQVGESFAQSQEQMQSDHAAIASNWHFSHGQLTPSAQTHHRESSLSSLGSAGPSSPFNHNTSHPQVILPSDSAGELYYEGLLPPHLDQTCYIPYAKPLTPHTPSQDTFLTPSYQHYNPIQTYPSDTHYAAMMALHKHHSGDEETIPLEYANLGRPSVASTRNSPVTPQTTEDFDDQNRKFDFRQNITVPKLDRTMSDAYNDELYSPHFSFTSAPPPKQSNSMSSSQHSDVFSQRLQAANSQHLSASSNAPLVDQTRGRSPFRQGSPLAPVAGTFVSQSSPSMRLGSAAHLREQQKAESEARLIQEQMERSSSHQSTPKTISPKDALLEYHESEEDSNTPLFPPRATPQYKLPNTAERPESQSEFEDDASQQSFPSMATSRRESSSAYSGSSQNTAQHTSGFNFIPPSVPGGIQVPHHYPFNSQQRRQGGGLSSTADRTPEFPSSLNSMDSGSSEYTPDTSEIRRPSASNADTGTYTCTYHGCTLRFETPAKLQKHKREGHRQSVPLVGSGVASHGGNMTTLSQTQSGPHRCIRINPSTGKPCNTVFSRPYDLTRHEDTIHNARKQKVRCHLCTEEKTFSRADALSRHFRVVHPSAPAPGKSRRRGHD